MVRAPTRSKVGTKGYELTFTCLQPTMMVCLLDAHRERSQELRYEIPPTTIPAIPTRTYLDTFGNTVQRFIAPPGDLTITSDAVIEDSGLSDPIELDAKKVPIEQLPDETLVFLLGSRYCETDRLADIAWRHFGSSPRGWRRVQAICDFVCDHLTFGYEHARATRTAFEAYEERIGVCRDFARRVTQMVFWAILACHRTRPRWTTTPGSKSFLMDAGSLSTRATIRRALAASPSRAVVTRRISRS